MTAHKYARSLGVWPTGNNAPRPVTVEEVEDEDAGGGQWHTVQCRRRHSDSSRSGGKSTRVSSPTASLSAVQLHAVEQAHEKLTLSERERIALIRMVRA